MNRYFSALTICLVLCASTQSMAQTTWDVGGGNNDFATLSAALVDATVIDNDILVIYSNQIADHISGKHLTIRSANPGTPRDINRITLNEGASNSLLEDLVLSNTGGTGSENTVILDFVSAPGSPVNATITRCAISSISHGILMNGGILTIAETTITSGDFGIGQEIAGGVINITDSSISDSAIAGINVNDISTVTGTGINTITNAYNGISLSAFGAGTLAISGITITGSTNYGIHIINANPSAAFDIIDCNIVNGLLYGLVIESNDSLVNLQGGTIANHEVVGVGAGGGFWTGVENSTLIIEDTIFTDNYILALILGDQSTNTLEMRRVTMSAPIFFDTGDLFSRAMGILSSAPANILIEDTCSFTDLNIALHLTGATTASVSETSFERNGISIYTSDANATTTNCTFSNTNINAVLAASFSPNYLFTDNGSTFESITDFQFNSQGVFNNSSFKTTCLVSEHGQECVVALNGCALSGPANIVIQDYSGSDRPVPPTISLNNCQMETTSRFIIVEGEGIVTVNGGTFTGYCGDVMLNINHPQGSIILNGNGASIAEKLTLDPVINGGTIIIGRIAAGHLSLKNITATVMAPGFFESWSDLGQGSLLGNVFIEYDQCAFFNGSGTYRANLSGTTPSAHTITVNAVNTLWIGSNGINQILRINAEDEMIDSAAINLEHCTLTATANALIDGNISFDQVTALPDRDTLTANYCIFDAAGSLTCSESIFLNGSRNLIAPGSTGSGGFLPGQPGDTLILASAEVDRNTGLLLADSRAINNAATSVTTIDFLGFSRPYSTAPDIGAHEFYGIPAAPSNLSATAYFDQHITLYWTDNTNDETGFIIERRIDAGTWTEVASIGENIESWQDDDVLAATLYTYRVRTYNTVHSSPYSNEANAETSSSTGLRVAVVGPTLVHVVIDDYTEFEVTVQGETGIATYQWYFDDGILGAVAIPGAESSILAIPVAIEDNSGQYWCTVTDDVETLPSATITLVVTQDIPLASAAGLAFLGTMIIVGGTVLMGRCKKK